VSQLIHSLVELLPEEQKWFPVNTTAPRFTVAELDDDDALRTLGLPARTEAIWDDLISFFKRRWFKRVWVLQEVALQKEAMVLWGSRPSKVVHQYNIVAPFGTNGFCKVARKLITIDKIRPTVHDKVLQFRSYRHRLCNHPIPGNAKMIGLQALCL
jgi:hypothetical protein